MAIPNAPMSLVRQIKQDGTASISVVIPLQQIGPQPTLQVGGGGGFNQGGGNATFTITVPMAGQGGGANIPGNFHNAVLDLINMVEDLYNMGHATVA